ncbi:uncharacterized protein LOC110737793 [Chenopodium quinoa]|uniref:uncharacterized protein LOC110737793 n=1 Tax=Chenopodium quinoa TaxID=63459 RepID=UPI000B78500D|nr:uncharacterized protein LOC110737793 [Chenopodium quinoa]
MQRGNYNPHINPFQTHQIHQIPPQIPRNPPINNPYNPPLNHPIHHLPPPQYPFSPEYERILRDEVIYLHSLWHRGPPSSTLNPNSQTPHYLKPSIPSIFKKTQKISKSLEPHLISDKEWPVESIPKCPSSSGSIWPEFKPHSAPASRPVTAEEKERVLGVKIHLKGLDCCSGLFHKEVGSDSDDDEEDDGDDVEEFEFFMKVFEEQEELRGYYKKNCENGVFYCLVCGALAGKLLRKYKNCVAVVQHSVTISNTKKRKAHRAYGHVICKILGWDVHRLPSLPSKDGDASSQSLEKSCVFPGVVDNHADGSKESPAVVEREGDFGYVSNSDAGPGDKPDAVEMENDSITDAGCVASESVQSVSESRVNADGCEADVHGSLKKEDCNSDNVQLEQTNTPDSAQKVGNIMREEGSAFGGESVNCELSLTGDAVK